jgi:molybdopterin molybdotransferase
MISVDEAQRLVLDSAAIASPTTTSLDAALGLVLAEDATSDLDMPPYSKSLMDGFAVRTADLVAGRAELQVVARIVAGERPSEQAISDGQAVQIMTGAPIPPGADAVVMVERTTRCTDQATVAIDDPGVRPGQNVMRRGAEMTRGQIVLKARTQLRPAEIGVLAAVGRPCVPVFPRPRVAVISTGNEIVEADQTPGPGQIRNSNGPTLAALVAAAGGEPRYFGIARDTRDDLRRLARAGFDADIVILSGGVSAGDLDLVPGVLRELGVREVFHKVDLKPGKPVWFGVVETPEVPSTLNAQPSTLVFGLPGNPVSVVVCFELFVRPAIRQILGLTPAVSPLVTATLGEDKNYRSDRPTYWPARLEFGDGGRTVRPVAWLGSPDLRANTEANGFIFFPPGDHKLRAGDSVQVLACDW